MGFIAHELSCQFLRRESGNEARASVSTNCASNKSHFFADSGISFMLTMDYMYIGLYLI